jgi:hypothetical protein
MGLRGPKKNPNAKEIRNHQAKVKRDCQKASIQLMNEVIAEYVVAEYSIAVKAAKNVKKPAKRTS